MIDIDDKRLKRILKEADDVDIKIMDIIKDFLFVSDNFHEMSFRGVIIKGLLEKENYNTSRTLEERYKKFKLMGEITGEKWDE